MLRTIFLVSAILASGPALAHMSGGGGGGGHGGGGGGHMGVGGHMGGHGGFHGGHGGYHRGGGGYWNGTEWIEGGAGPVCHQVCEDRARW
jgi:hypothetical protein